MKISSQKARIANLFLSRPNQWIPLTEILGLFIAQYNARIHELRYPEDPSKAMKIENKLETKDGSRHTWYRYVPKVTEDLFKG